MAADEDDKTSGDTTASAKGPQDRRARDKRQKPPVTIDLAAEDVRPKASDFDVKGGAAGKEQQSPPPPKSEASGASAGPASGAQAETSKEPGRFGAAARAFAGDDGWRRSAIAGVIGGIAAFVLAIMLQAVGLLPAPGRSAANQAVTAVRDASDALASLDRRVTAMEAMTSGLPAMRADIKTVDTRASSLEAAIPTLATRHDMEATAGAVDVMRQQLAKMPAGPSESDFTALAERVNKLEVAVATAAAATGSGDGASSEGLTALAGQVSDAKSELTALAARLKDAEGKIATLGNGEVGNGAAAVRAMAVVSLRRAASGSQPFEDEVDGLAALGGAPDLVAKLRPYATTGVKSQSELAATFSATADAIITATTQSDSSANFFTRVLNGLSHLVSVRPAGPVAGDDPPAVVSRMTAAVNKGDLAAALKERQSLPEGGQVASAAWAKDAEARVALDGLVETAARSLASPAGTG